MEKFKFYKEWDHRWYIDLPSWTGSKADLEMVANADSMLEFMAQGQNEIWVNISDTEFVNANKLIFVRNADEIGNGAFYILNQYQGIDLNLEMWLCDVTKFVFGDFPNVIYISVIEN